jgi:hypothetical protein
MAVNLTIMVDVSYDQKTDNNIKMINFMSKLEAQWAKPVSLTCHFALRKRYTGPSIG